MHGLFSLQRIFITPSAEDLLAGSGDDPRELIARHVTGDPGELDAHDQALWVEALAEGEQLLSVYLTRNKERIYVITEADRSVTTILTPDDY